MINIFRDMLKVKKNINISANLTSYDTVWATERNLPNNAYFLFEAHPENKTGYTFILNIM